MKRNLEIAARFVLVLIIALSFVPVGAFARCEGGCLGGCGNYGHFGREIAVEMVSGSGEVGCCSGSPSEPHTCCNVETDAPQSGPEFLLTTIFSDQFHLFPIFGQCRFSSPVAREYFHSKSDTDYLKAGPTPIYLQNLSILC